MHKINTNPIKLKLYTSYAKKILKKYSLYISLVSLGVLFIYFAISPMSRDEIEEVLLTSNKQLTSCAYISTGNEAIWTKTLFEKVKYSKNVKQDGNIYVPPFFFINLPNDISFMSEKDRVELLSKIFLPIIAKIEKGVLADKQRLDEILNNILTSPISPEDASWLTQKASEYNEPFSAETVWDYYNLSESLSKKIDIIEPSIIIGIAGLNTDWGSRTSLVKSNKYFGALKDMTFDDYLINARSMSTRYQSFSSIEKSVLGVYKALNTYNTFADYRKYRERNEKISLELLNTLKIINAYDSEFPKKLLSTIQKNQLLNYDNDLVIIKRPSACLKFQ